MNENSAVVSLTAGADGVLDPYIAAAPTRTTAGTTAA